MKLRNFDLQNPSATIILLGLGVEWDLHNFAIFQGLAYDTTQNAVLLQWTVPRVENPWGSVNNHFAGCTLRFQNVSALTISPRRPDALAEDDACMSGVSKVLPESDEYRHLDTWPPHRAFHLRFEFESGRTIEIAAESAELIPRAAATE